MELLKLMRGLFSLDTLIYLAIVLVLLGSMARCLLPLSGMTRRLRRAARVVITENKQNKEKKSWNDLHFLGDRRRPGLIFCRTPSCATRTANPAT